jgi:hypothetical protein
MSPKKVTLNSARGATAPGKAAKGFSDEERGAMKARVEELKAEERRGPNAKKADGEDDVLAKIAEMPEPDRVMAERLHAIIKASVPTLSPKTWYGMPAYAKDGNVVAGRLCAEGVDRRRRGKDRRARQESVTLSRLLYLHA